MTKRNFGLSFEKLPADPYRPTGEPETVRSFISGDLKETVAAGFLVTFAVLVGALFGVFTFFASLLIEPSGTTQLVQYEQHLGLNR